MRGAPESGSSPEQGDGIGRDIELERVSIVKVCAVAYAIEEHGDRLAFAP